MASNMGADDAGPRDDPPVDWETLYRLVSRPERCGVLDHLREHGDATVETLARAVATGNGESPDNARVALVHVHLPKLRNGGLVAWDRESGRARLTAAGRQVDLAELTASH